MPLQKAPFDSEQELHDWASGHIQNFLPKAHYIPGFPVETITGKRCVPDGFAFNFEDREWFVIESELLGHGVWKHIAEQIIRFVVAMQNPQNRRIIRNRIYDHILSNNLKDEVTAILETTSDRLWQQIELFIEGTRPEIVIFIDDTNQDLHEMALALSTSTRVYQIEKFIINDQVEYYSDDYNQPTLTTEPMENVASTSSDYEIVAQLGGGELAASKSKFKCYRINDGSVINIKRSVFHEDYKYYWYGVTAVSLQLYEKYGITHVVFVMGEEGFAIVPLGIVKEIIKHAKYTKNPDGSIRHYHVSISPPPEPVLYYSKEKPKFPLAEHFRPF